MLSDIQHEYMKRTLDLAFTSMGVTSPNPAVGAVIVRDGQVVGEGATSPYGGDHAEVVALSMAGNKSRGADMYVSLEPCCHYGKTPPCTGAIIKAGIKRVFIPLLDPNPVVAGRGMMTLREHDVEVVLVNEMADYASDMIRGFKKSILRKRCYVIHKTAISLDGRIATSAGDSRWISSPLSRLVVHRLRATVDAIIVGKNTLEKDNPTLNIRLGDFDDSINAFFMERQWTYTGRDNSYIENILRGTGVERTGDPLRVVIGLPGNVHPSMNMFRDNNYVIFCEEGKRDSITGREDAEFLRDMEAHGNIVFCAGNRNREQVYFILEELYRRGVVNVLLEGGGAVAGSFLDAGEIDHFMYFITPRILGNGIPALLATGSESVSESMLLRDVSITGLDRDIMYTGYREPYLFESM